MFIICSESVILRHLDSRPWAYNWYRSRKWFRQRLGHFKRKFLCGLISNFLSHHSMNFPFLFGHKYFKNVGFPISNSNETLTNILTSIESIFVSVDIIFIHDINAIPLDNIFLYFYTFKCEVYWRKAEFRFSIEFIRSEMITLHRPFISFDEGYWLSWCMLMMHDAKFIYEGVLENQS